jgi:hypothetical protein
LAETAQRLAFELRVRGGSGWSSGFALQVGPAARLPVDVLEAELVIVEEAGQRRLTGVAAKVSYERRPP